MTAPREKGQAVPQGTPLLDEGVCLVKRKEGYPMDLCRERGEKNVGKTTPSSTEKGMQMRTNLKHDPAPRESDPQRVGNTVSTLFRNLRNAVFPKREGRKKGKCVQLSI